MGVKTSMENDTITLLLTLKFPKWVLQREDGNLYLERTVLWGSDCLDNNDTVAPSHAFIHRIHSADGDRHRHNHPWAWSVAVILSGGYGEERQYGDNPQHSTFREYSVGDVNILKPDDYHSIVTVEPDTVTLFLAGRKTQDWGFYVDGVHVPHNEYFKRSDAQHMTHFRQV